MADGRVVFIPKVRKASCGWRKGEGFSLPVEGNGLGMDIGLSSNTLRDIHIKLCRRR